MVDLTTEGRLELVRQVRNSYNKNRYDMSNRERLLFGKQTFHEYDNEKIERGNFFTEYPLDGQNSLSNRTGMFKVRLIAGILLFFFLFAIDSGNFSFAGYAPEEIFEAISHDYVAVFDEMISNLNE